MDRKKYKNPPIREAVIDLKVDPSLTVSPSKLESLRTKLSERYSIVKPRRSCETSFFAIKGVPSTVSKDKGIDGYQFWSSDEKDVVQFRLDGFTFSRLAPYVEWEEHSPEAFKTWNIYRDNLKPLKIKRLAVRYVNVIEVPKKTIELSDYFINPPTIPSGLSQDMEAFLSRFIVKFDSETKAIITASSQKQSNPDKLPFLLDIDVFSEISIESNSVGITERLEKLHIVAENIFESSLTKTCKELFN